MKAHPPYFFPIFQFGISQKRWKGNTMARFKKFNSFSAIQRAEREVNGFAFGSIPTKVVKDKRRKLLDKAIRQDG